VTADKFRRLALALPGVYEQQHMKHPDFRISGKIMATLGYPDEAWGTVKLTPEQQSSFVKASPESFRPCRGVWGERGATNVQLASASVATVRAAIAVARQNLVAKVEGSLAPPKRPGRHSRIDSPSRPKKKLART
jgi:hypothetical protein